MLSPCNPVITLYLLALVSGDYLRMMMGIRSHVLPEAPVRIVSAATTSMAGTSVYVINLQEPSLNLEP